MSRKKVLVVSDAAYPMGTTAFGLISGKVIEELQRQDFQVLHMARSMRQLPKQEPNYRVFMTPSSDPNGYASYLGQVCEAERPDVIFYSADPGSIKDWRRSIEARRVPNVAFAPTEAGPMLEPWSSAMWELDHMGGAIATYTKHSRQVMLDAFQMPTKRPIEVLGLGTDHAPFRVYSESEREAVREIMGWTDRFVVINVARNAGRKMLPRLMKAAKLAQEKIPNLLLYLHTVAFENYFLGGHNLKELATHWEMQDYTMFHSEMRDGAKGISYEGIGQGKSDIGLIDLYNAADLFVSTSGGEGWNVPQCEAAACGLPCLVPNYGSGWEVAEPFAVGLPISQFDTQPNGNEFGLVDPWTVSDFIFSLQRNPAYREYLGVRGLEAAEKMKWEPTVKRLVEIIGEVA